MATPASGSLTTAVNHFHIVRGFFVTNAACNVRLNVTSSAGTITPRNGSMYTIRKVGPVAAMAGTFVA
jgi:hypothetical protein